MWRRKPSARAHRTISAPASPSISQRCRVRTVVRTEEPEAWKQAKSCVPSRLRAARAIAGLRVQSNEWSVEEAVLFAAENTPRGWFRPDGDLVLFEQQLYLQQPGYGTSYLTGKALIESLLAERGLELGDTFTVKGFWEEVFASGLIPVSLIRWEMTGRGEQVRRLLE